MRLIKMVGLAVAAIAAMALVGVGSAAAEKDTSLCSVNELPCSLANQAKIVHFATTAEPLLSTNFPSMHMLCLASLVQGHVEKGLTTAPKPQGIEVLSLTWEGCYALPIGEKHNCTVTTEVTGLLDILKTAENLGTVKPLNTEIRIVCGAIMNCFYGGVETPGLTVEGALHNGAIHKGLLIAFYTPVPKVKGSLCPAFLTLAARYESLTHLWISS